MDNYYRRMITGSGQYTVTRRSIRVRVKALLINILSVVIAAALTGLIMLVW